MAGPRGTGTPGVTPSTGTTWSPTVANLVVLVVLEIVAYCALRWSFRTVHGG